MSWYLPNVFWVNLCYTVFEGRHSLVYCAGSNGVMIMIINSTVKD